MKIKFKILAGFLLIIVMLLIAGIMSIYEFSRIGNSVKLLIDNNYQTIEASRTMIKSLEREDSGILLLISGKKEKGRSIIQAADTSFTTALNIAKSNISENNETELIEKIEESYKQFKSNWVLLLISNDQQNSIDWYLSDVHENFLNVMQDVESLMDLNQTGMYQEASILKNQSIRAITPGIVAIISSLIFLIMFNFLIRIILVRPISKLTTAVKQYHSPSCQFNPNVLTNDELKTLEIEIQNLIQRLQK